MKIDFIGSVVITVTDKDKLLRWLQMFSVEKG